jgi:hypothetical protein
MNRRGMFFSAKLMKSGSCVPTLASFCPNSSAVPEPSCSAQSYTLNALAQITAIHIMLASHMNVLKSEM